MVIQDNVGGAGLSLRGRLILVVDSSFWTQRLVPGAEGGEIEEPEGDAGGHAPPAALGTWYSYQLPGCGFLRKEGFLQVLEEAGAKCWLQNTTVVLVTSPCDGWLKREERGEFKLADAVSGLGGWVASQ